MSSIVADELAKIKSFGTDTEKRRSTLTLNELNYISDKQLHKKDGGSSSPVKVATLDLRVSSGLPTSAVLYFPAEEGVPDNVADSDLSSDDLYSVVVPQLIGIAPEWADALEITGDARVIHEGNDCYIYVTGDCTIAESGGGI